MDTTKMTLAFLLGAAVSGALTYKVTGKTVEVVAEAAAPDALLDAATPQCAAEVRLRGPAPVCTKTGVSVLGNDREPTTGLWQCDGAIMGPREQACLSAAAAKLPLDAGEAEEIGP